MTAVTMLGLLAGTLTTVAFVPQVVKTWRTGATHDISLLMFSIMASGNFAWLLYGAIIRDLPLVLANGVTLVLSSTILFFKIRNSLTGDRPVP